MFISNFLTIVQILISSSNFWRRKTKKKTKGHFKLVSSICGMHSNLYFSSSVSKQGKVFRKHFIFKLYVKICWYELQEKTVTSNIASTTIFTDCVVNISKISIILAFAEGQPDHGWSSSDISSHLKCKSNLYIYILPKAYSLKDFQKDYKKFSKFSPKHILSWKIIKIWIVNTPTLPHPKKRKSGNKSVKCLLIQIR